MESKRTPTALEYSPDTAILEAAAYILRNDSRIANYSPEHNEDLADTLEDIITYLK